jgi:hypothetical protein
LIDEEGGGMKTLLLSTLLNTLVADPVTLLAKSGWFSFPLLLQDLPEGWGKRRARRDEP